MSNKSVVLLYGLPCSGKSMVVKTLSDHAVITVDGIITTIIDDPSIADFQRLGNEIVDRLIMLIQGLSDTKFVIEMGCLMPRVVIDRLERFMCDSGFRFSNVMLSARDEVLIRRIEQRNADIDAGNSSSIKVDGPDYLTRFKEVFDRSRPDDYVVFDTSDISREHVVEKVRKIVDTQLKH